jgi:hypothetical protein
MLRRLVPISVGAVLLLVSPVATADEGGVAKPEAEAAPPEEETDAALVDGAALACDGSLCDTQTGTTCDIGALSPGHFAPSAAGLVWLGGLVLTRRRRSGNGAKRPFCDTVMGQGVPPASLAKGDAKKVTISSGFYKRLC